MTWSLIVVRNTVYTAAFVLLVACFQQVEVNTIFAAGLAVLTFATEIIAKI
jgi:hypothetical protein